MMTDLEMLHAIGRLPLNRFHGSLEDLFMIQEVHSLRAGLPSGWIKRVYDANFPSTTDQPPDALISEGESK